MNAEWQNYSLLVYALPMERATRLIPDSFQIEEFTITGATGSETRCALVSVESCLDQGSGYGDGLSFEQTRYRLHVRHNGEAGTWLLGTAVGSLTAVAPRHLWSLPWHLSAMEFQVLWNAAEGRYQEYRLQTSSQWANATWELRDTGIPMDFDADYASLEKQLSASLRTSKDWFQRKDEMIGEYRITRSSLHFTRGQVLTARCDLLERLELVTRAELMNPLMIALQQRMTSQIYSPVVETAVSSF